MDRATKPRICDARLRDFPVKLDLPAEVVAKMNEFVVAAPLPNLRLRAAAERHRRVAPVSK